MYKWAHRPTSFSDFVGQNSLKKVLITMAKSSEITKKTPDHVILFGPPGHGKTTIAHVFAKYLKAPIIIAQGPTFEKKSDFLTFFATIKKNSVIFIDEFHAINKSIDELFYTVLEEGKIDLLVGVEGDAKVMRMDLPPFTLVAATTENSKISTPLFDRFGFNYMMESYSAVQIKRIISKNAKRLKINLNNENAMLIANHSAFNPRFAIKLLHRIIDFAIADKNNFKDLEIDQKIIKSTLKVMGIFSFGLQKRHISYLSLFSQKSMHQGYSLESLANILNDKMGNITSNIEPLLIRLNLIKISSVGRQLTSEGRDYLQKIKMW